MTHEADHDDRHDRGLRHDLAVLRARQVVQPALLERRGALKLLGGAGVGLLLAACGSDDASTAGTTSTAGGPGSTTTAAAGATTTTSAATGTVTEAIPEETGGPYPGDGSNGPNVLTESGIVRSDIRSSFGDLSGTADGVPVGLDLTIVSAGDGSPMAGAAVYLWHCDIDGGYSLYSQGITEQNYLRGVQAADADGRLSFTSIYPAVYSGRWPHMHYEVFAGLDEATAAARPLVTSQIALLEDASRAVYESDAGYAQSVSNLTRVSLDSDMVFSDGYDLQLPTMSGAAGADLRLALTVAV
jgi:protocatechuate 3,4-dioxygenase beta subunit